MTGSASSILRRVIGGAALATAALLGGCGGDGGSPAGPEPAPCPVRERRSTGAPSMYTVDTLTGVASVVGGAFTPPVSGEHFGLTFAGDELRLQSVESNAGQAYDPSSGAATSSGPALAYVAGDPSDGADPAIAATGALPGGEIYGVDATANALVRIDPVAGTLTTVGGLGFNVYLCSGMDIDTDGTAFAALSTETGSELYTVDLETGAARLLGEIGGAPVHSIAIRP